MNTYRLSSLALAAVLTACGGGGSSSGGSGSETPAAANVGVFTDSAVAGIRYETSPGNKSGTTTALGEYDYLDGDTVTFSIGGISLPAVTATGRITPADMASTEQADQVSNILRLLQSLDDDGNPDNGITISEGIHTALESATLTLGQSQAAFETEYASAVGTPTEKTLISAEEAEAHFDASRQADLRVSWLFVEPAGESSNGKGPNGEEVNVLTFLEGDRYIVAHKYGNDDQGTATAEWGYYDWNPNTGDITFSAVGQSDGDGGLCEELGEGCGQDTVRLVNDELHLGSEADATVPFTAIRTTDPAVVGSWYLAEADDDEMFNVVVIMDDGTYLVSHNNRDGGDASLTEDTATSEWGDYQLDNGVFSVTAITSETDGDGGLSDMTANCSAVEWGELNCEDGDEDFRLFRVGRFPVELRMFDDDGERIYSKTATVERSASERFAEGQATSFRYELPTEEGFIQVNLNADGSGTVDFFGEETSNIENGWRVNTAGTLDYYETMEDGSTGHWVFAPLKDRNGKDIVLVTFSHVDGDTQHLSGFFISELSEPDQVVQVK